MPKKGFTKSYSSPYTFYSGGGYEFQLPKYMVEQMVEQALNKFGFDVATKAAQQQALNLANENVDFLIEKDLKHYENAKATAEELSLLLIKGRQLINDPIGYAMDKAKNKIREDFQISNAFGGLANKEIALRYAGQQTLETVLNVATTAADAAINRYTTLQEDYLTNQAYTNAQTTISKAKQLAGGVVGGVVAGLKIAGPAGAIIGGTAAVVSHGATQYFEYQKRMSSYYQQLNSTNFETGFSASRAGLVNNGRGTEN